MKVKNLIEAILLAFFCRLIVHGASVGDSLCVLGLVGYLGYQKYLVKLEVKDPTVELTQRLRGIEDRCEKTEAKIAGFTMKGMLR